MAGFSLPKQEKTPQELWLLHLEYLLQYRPVGVNVTTDRLFRAPIEEVRDLVTTGGVRVG